MKKYILVVFIIVACFHDAFESKIDSQSKASTNTVNITLHIHIDHTFESITLKNVVEKSFLRAKFISNASIPKELHYKIWKPPVIS